MKILPHLKRRFPCVIFCSILLLTAGMAGPKNFIRLVNPFIGTGGHGHTFPGATAPFGMVQLSPDTRVEGWDACSGYHYSDSTILGFSHTHLSGTGCADYGDILLLPLAGDIPAPGKIFARFNHNNEQASPGYYRVLLDNSIEAELTATVRTGLHRYRFPAGSDASIFIDLQHGIGPDKVIESSLDSTGANEIAGMRRSDGWASDQLLYFVIRFSAPIRQVQMLLNDSAHAGSEAAGQNVKGIVHFKQGSEKTSDGLQIVVKVGLSSVSIDGARKNLEAEAPDWNFDAIRSQTEAMWNAELEKIEARGGTEEQLTTFYTALYHAMIAPNVYSDEDGRYRGMDKQIHTADGFTMYTVFSLWDTFRAEHPLFTIIDRKRTLDFVKSLLAKYDEAKMLPVWELSSNETWCMIGYHSVPVIADAFVKGITGFDAAHALEAMEHSANADHFGLQAYREFGYVPAEREAEDVSKTLEYSYDDWCIARMAEAMGKKDDQAVFEERGQYFKNLFDPSVGFMRPKLNGGWDAPFDPAAVTSHYTEANPWQYSFFVPQDVPGLIAINGGREKFIQKLDTLFFGSSQLTGREQADITGLIGRYAQGNEPSHHVAYLYNDAGAPWKTQEIVRRTLDSLYGAGCDGLCGNDDCGQMSAWYVMSAMGFYEVAPGNPVYSIGSPLFGEVTIHLENGKEFVISAKQNSRENKYIREASFNGTSLTVPSIRHADMMNGGTLAFTMGPAPNTGWGTELSQRQPSSVKPITIVPVVAAPARTFTDSLTVSLSTNDPNTGIRYTLNGAMPDRSAKKYSGPIVLLNTTTVKTFATEEGCSDSRIVSATFRKTEWIGTIRLQTAYAPQYSGGSEHALIDGIRGEKDFRLGAWQGYEQNDLDAVIDLGTEKTIDTVALGCLQDNNSWIFFPTGVKFSFSSDGKHFEHALSIANPVSPKEDGVSIRDFAGTVDGLKARYVKVTANNIGLCPPWHKGAGNKAWLFVDEVVVRTRR